MFFIVIYIKNGKNVKYQTHNCQCERMYYDIQLNKYLLIFGMNIILPTDVSIDVIIMISFKLII